MKTILFSLLLIGFSALAHASDKKCGKVEQLYYKAYLDMPKYSGIIMGISGNNGNAHHIPDSAVPLATAAKANGLEICYSVKLDDEGRVYIDELKLK